DAGRQVELVELRVGGFVAGLEPFFDDDVASRAGTDAAASVVEAGFDAFRNVENASGQAVVAVGNLRRIDFNGLAAWKKRDFVFLRGGLVFYFVDVRIASAHFFSPLTATLPDGKTTCQLGRSSAAPLQIRSDFRDLAAFERAGNRTIHHQFR